MATTGITVLDERDSVRRGGEGMVELSVAGMEREGVNVVKEKDCVGEWKDKRGEEMWR